MTMKRRMARGAAKLAGGVMLAAAAFFSLGSYSGDQELVEDVYTVKRGDTLWGIARTYMAKNTGGERYILEFIEGIKELNPELHGKTGDIYPGQVLRINYFVKKEG